MSPFRVGGPSTLRCGPHWTWFAMLRSYLAMNTISPATWPTNSWTTTALPPQRCRDPRGIRRGDSTGRRRGRIDRSWIL